MPNIKTILSGVAPHSSKENQSAGWFVGSLATIAALLSAVGISTGEVQRVLRNEPLPAGLMVACVVVAAAYAASAGWFIKADDNKEKHSLSVSAVFFTLAALAGVWTGVQSARERPEPGIAVKLSADSQGRRTLRFSVSDSGLRSTDQMRIIAQALVEDNRPLAPKPLYGASVGPDRSGNARYIGEIVVPSAPVNEVEIQAWVGKRYKCYEEGQTHSKTASTGCVTVHVERPFEKPQLSVVWRRPRHSSAGLQVSVLVHDIGGHRLVLRIKDVNSRHLLLSAHWPPNAVGDVNKKIVLSIPRPTHRLCVAASAIATRPNCSEQFGTGTSSVLTVVPPR